MDLSCTAEGPFLQNHSRAPQEHGVLNSILQMEENLDIFHAFPTEPLKEANSKDMLS
jgi:hypothetical protein